VNGARVLAVVEPVVFVMIGVALLLVFVRLARGPSLSDRVIALDLMAVLAVGLIAMVAFKADQPIFLDAAIVLALVAFLGTVAFARYLERRAYDE
jgi:multicomponent Na+:H+ antiporter subunit F